MAKMTLEAIRGGIEKTPDKILLYGVEGIGKSTFGASAPSPIFVPCEQGIDEIDVPAFPRPETYEDVVEALKVLYAEEHPYKTVVIDTLDALEPLIWTHICKANGWANIESPGYGKGYTVVDKVWIDLLGKLDKLRERRGMEVVLLAHSVVSNVSDPSSADYQRWTVALHKRAAGLVRGWCKTMMFACHEQFVNEETKKAISTGKRVMHTVHRSWWDAKNRYQLPEEMPLDYGAFAEARANYFKKDGE